MIAGVEVYRAKAAFQQDGKNYPAGTFVIPFDQVFGRYAKDLLEKQTYPEVRRSPGAPAEAPYDVSAWSLGMQFGVKHGVRQDAARGRSRAGEGHAEAEVHAGGREQRRGAWRFPYNGALSAMVVNRLLQGGAKVSLTKPEAGGIPLVIASARPEVWTKATEGFEVKPPPATAAGQRRQLATALNRPRIGIYQSYDPSMDEGWTRFVLDEYGFEYTKLHNADIRKGKLRQSLDAIILPDQRTASILDGVGDYKTLLPEYRGGIGEEGLDGAAAVRGRGRHAGGARRGVQSGRGEAAGRGEGLEAQHDARSAFRARHGREPAGGHRASGRLGRAAGHLRLLHQLAVFPADGGLRLAEGERGGAVSQYRRERVRAGCAARI